VSARFSAGPWVVADNTSEPFGQLTVDSARDGAVAVCFTACRDVTSAPMECVANARLIAAAPDLHRLAIAARDYLSGIPETAAGGDDAAVALARQIDRLIASIEAAAAPAQVTP
jgi:hypothetical protein